MRGIGSTKGLRHIEGHMSEYREGHSRDIGRVCGHRRDIGRAWGIGGT